MTRYKEYIRKRHNISLEIDYPFLPYNIGSNGVEGVSCSIENNKIVVRTYYTSITILNIIDNKGNIEQDFED